MIVTTSSRENPSDCRIAIQIAEHLNTKFVARERLSFQQLSKKYNASLIVVIKNQLPFLRNMHGEELFFHPGMSGLRILNRSRGLKDNMIMALGLEKGFSLLDCTVGLASDALLAAYEVGEGGIVVGIESMPLIALITRYGLQRLTTSCFTKYPELSAAAGKIRIIQQNHQVLLRLLPDNSFDVVYFDPMFRSPKTLSSGIRPLRPFADDHPLDYDSVKEALRIARRRVVIKESAGSSEFDRLNIHYIVGGDYGSIHYGVLLKGEVC